MDEFWIKDENGEHDYGSKEDSMIESMYTDPDLFCELYGRKDKYGGNNKGLCASTWSGRAGRYARKYGGDELVAIGIYLGVAAADPVFDEVGEEFLKTILPDYNKADYAEDLFRGMLFGIKTVRKEIIVKGIRDIIEGNENDSIEVQAVKVCMKREDLYMAIKACNHQKAESLDIRFNLLIEVAEDEGITDLNQQYEYAYNRIKDRLEEMDKQGLIAKPLEPDYSKLPILMEAYDYFMEHFDKIPQVNFLRLFPQYADNKEKLVAYYVATRPDEGLVAYMEAVKEEEK